MMELVLHKILSYAIRKFSVLFFVTEKSFSGRFFLFIYPKSALYDKIPHYEKPFSADRFLVRL